MAPPRSLTRRSRADTGQGIVEADWSRGIIRDAPRPALPAGSVYDAADYLLHQPGVAQKRGGTAYAGPEMTGATYAAAVAYAEFATGAKLVGEGDNGHLYNITAGATTDVGFLGTAFPSVDRPKLRVDKLIIPANDGVTPPQKYDGSTIGPVGGSPPGGKYVEVYKSRVVLGGNAAAPTRIFFSQTPDIEATWDTANAYLDMDYPVTGIAALQNALIVFSEGHVEQIVGDDPPPDIGITRAQIASVGCTDARSIVAQEASVLFANPGGVYILTSGYPTSLTKEGGIESYWQSLFAGYDRATWTIAAGVHRSFYFVTVMNAGALVATLMCNIPRRSWWRLTNVGAVMMARAVGAAEELYFADRATNHVTALSKIFVPTAGNKSDADGTPVEPLLELRMLGRGPGLKHFLDGFLSYNMVDAATDDPALAISVAPGLEASPAFVATAESPFGENTEPDRQRFTIAEVSQGVSLRLQQTGASQETELYAVEVEERPLHPSMAGATW